MALVIKFIIFVLFVGIGIIAISACVGGNLGDEEYPICAIDNEYCRYDYSVFTGGNPCEDCKTFKEWKGEFDGRENREL